MRVKVHFYGQIRQKAGVEHTDIDLAEGTVLRLAFSALAARHGEAFGRMVLEPSGRVHPNLICLVNDVPATGDEHVLKDGDGVALFSPVAGG